MLSRKLYYLVKPYIPWGTRMLLRRRLARRIREKTTSIWPINESTKNPPPGWSPWPNDSKFAFVLTHDIEGADGLAKCRQLAELEMSLGFRSSFNFVPEGTYKVPLELRDWLLNNGFEVGVHDLHHDGKLFSSHQGFKEKANQINRYLNEWGATGYRSGFMLRNLDWLHDLNITYDASTFDTDPFEPQPDGAGTIFPYWIPAPLSTARHNQNSSQQELGFQPNEKQGYVELPYTLPQDSTLYFVLNEKTPIIWIRKADWVAAKGGMALVNVHPDYINFSGTPTSKEYPASHYKSLLNHISTNYSGSYWNPLPSTLARWYKENCNPSSKRSNPPFLARPPTAEAAKSQQSHHKLKGKRAAVLLYSRYPSDPRPRRAAEALKQAGMEIDLLCLSGNEAEANQEMINGVNVTRIPLQHRRDSKLVYFWQYGRFLFSSFWFLLSRSFKFRYDLVHVHNMPDFLVFAALIPKLRGAKIILDLHDPMPELMESIYSLKKGDWKVALLRNFERWSIALSDVAITPNITFKNLFTSRSCTSAKMQIVMNSPQEEVFDPRRYPTPAKSSNVFRVMHHGSIVHRHGVDILVNAIAKLKSTIPEIRLDIYGNETPYLFTVLDLANELGIADAIVYHGPKTQTEIAEAILACDLGVVPNRRSPFIEINFPTRLFEYISLGKPVIAPDTRGIQDYFSNEQILYFRADDVDHLSSQILWVYKNPNESHEIVKRGREVYHQYKWTTQKAHFTSVVSSLYK